MATSTNISQRQNLETFVLIWLDSLVNITQDNIDTKILLRKAINRLKTFDDSEKCLECIRSHYNEKVVLIVSGRLGQEIVPRIHQFSQLVAIYVYCSDKKRNEEWAKNFFKVKGVIIDLKELITQIQSDQIKRSEYKIDEPLPISIFQTKIPQKQSLSINNNNFIHFQLLIDCLSRMKSNSNDKDDLIKLCEEEYKENDTELNIIHEFEDKYSSDRAIWWFTRESFVCRMLNKAFQVIDIDILYYFRFFIHDIRQELKQNKCSSPIRTYRAQLMSKQDIQVLKHSIGELISINTFFSTILNRERAIAIFENSDVNEDLNRVLFEIDADPRLHDIKPFSDISLLTYFTGIEVILFMAGTIFHPVDIRQENNIIIIQMEACSDSDQKIKTILDDMKAKCYDGETNLLSLGYILLKMEKFDDAEKYYHYFLSEMPNHHQSVARCYQGLGDIAMDKQDYDSSLQWYQKALDIHRRILRSGDPELASGYSTIANVYLKKGAFIEAFDAYNEALKLWIRSLGKDDPKVAICYKNMGYVFEMEQKYPEALKYYQKALLLREKNLSPDQSDVAKLNNHIAKIYMNINDTSQALKHYNLALKILTKTYPSTHSDVITTIKNLGLAHEAAGNFNQALAQLEKVASILHQLLSSDHPEVIQILEDIQRVSSKLQ